MKSLLRWMGLVAFAALALELFFVLRIATMAVLNPESTTYFEWGDIVWVVGNWKKIQQFKATKVV